MKSATEREDLAVTWCSEGCQAPPSPQKVDLGTRERLVDQKVSPQKRSLCTDLCGVTFSAGPKEHLASEPQGFCSQGSEVVCPPLEPRALCRGSRSQETQETSRTHTLWGAFGTESLPAAAWPGEGWGLKVKIKLTI